MTGIQKIQTFLWFDNQAEEAVNHYTAAFKIRSLLADRAAPLLRDDERQRQGETDRVFAAMMQMIKFDVATLE